MTFQDHWNKLLAARPGLSEPTGNVHITVASFRRQLEQAWVAGFAAAEDAETIHDHDGDEQFKAGAWDRARAAAELPEGFKELFGL